MPPSRGERASGWTPRGPRLLGGAAAGLIAGLAAGAIDGLWTLERARQFLPHLGGQLRLLLYLGASYASVGMAVGAALATAGWLLGRTALGDAVRLVAARHREARTADPAGAVGPLALAIAAVPALAGTVALAYLAALRDLASRQHPGLVVAVSMAVGMSALLVAVAVTALVARPIERGLRRLARRPRIGRRLASRGLAVGALLGGLAAAVAAGLAVAWTTVRQTELRPIAASALLLALLAPLAPGRRPRTTLLGGRARRAAIATAALALVVGLTLAAGAGDAVQKAAAAASGLGGPIARAYRAAVDLDRDGASPVLAGGDCDDLDPDVGPAAGEIPDDGIDNNCVGGDVTSPAPHDPGFVPPPPALPPDFDVVLITIDTLRADHVGAYGYGRPTTPVLDALARDGALFENAWAHAPSTRYSMPAILTGRLPLAVDYVDIPRGWPGLSAANTLIAEVLAARGLAGVAVTNYGYFDRIRKMDQGFELYDNSNKRLHGPIGNEGPARTRGSSSREQTDKAIELLARLGDRRAFLWVHYYDPHADYEAHTGEFGDRPIDRYDDEIRFTDRHIGRLFDELRRLGRWDRAVVVVTGDHGEGFGEHGVTHHGYHLYAAQTRVPLIVRVPGLPPSRPTLPVGHVDILPTLANLAGAPPAPDMDGRSLVAALAGGPAASANRLVFQQLSYEGHHELRAAASQRCHVIYNVSPATSFEVYRIDEDPLERRDVTGAAGPCDAVRRDLAAWYNRSQLPRGAAAALLAAPPAIARPLDVDLGDEVRLLAVDLPSAPVAPGASFDATYTFAARGRPPAGWKVFVHLERDGGGRLQADHEPDRPFAWWRAGQFIRYTRAIAVPPTARPGVYRVWLGLFKGDHRRPARSATTEVVADRAAVGRVVVAP